jgi:transposase
MQVDPAAWQLDLVELAFAVLRAAGFEGEHLGGPGVPTGRDPAGHGWAARGLASASCGCSPSLRPGRSGGCGQRLGRPAISQRTLRRRVRQVAAWRRPRLIAKGDPDRDQILAELHQQLGDLPEGAVVRAEDETHVNLLPWVRSTWVARGTRQQVMTPGTNRRRTIFGAIDLASGRFCYQVCRKAVSASVIAFLAQLLAAYPTAPVVAVICDNVIIHRSQIVGRWLTTHPRIQVLHGARYSPHDNPTERIWATLKAWLANSPTLTIQSRVRQVHAFFRARSPAQLLATATPHSSPWLPEG